MKVFVYGTLKKGYHNHRLLKEAEYLGEAELKGYKIYDLPYGYPCIMKSEKNEVSVKGEVYLINDYILDRLDLLEGYRDKVNKKGNLYNRELKEVIKGDNEVIKVFVYEWGREELPERAILCKDGKWVY